jgi:hypothetical protein
MQRNVASPVIFRTPRRRLVHAASQTTGAKTSVRLIWRDGTLIRQPASEDPDRAKP